MRRRKRRIFIWELVQRGELVARDDDDLFLPHLDSLDQMENVVPAHRAAGCPPLTEIDPDQMADALAGRRRKTQRGRTNRDRSPLT